MDGRSFPLATGPSARSRPCPFKKNLYPAILAKQGARQPGVLAQEGVLARVLVEQAAELAKVFTASRRYSPRVLAACLGARLGHSARLGWCSASTGAPASSMQRRRPPRRH